MSTTRRVEAKEIRAVQNASRSLARLAILMRWAGEGVATASRSDLTPAQAQSFGLAVTWASEEIERHCAVIDEAM
ncbi:hypothetical protein [Komagataeibacter europaeus]|uniref:hypothetical protein n=1 Tax=Komagataeibacter europaeus TaxID=33995 RepID=UPI00031F6B4F|nr:hypothetical protein [Komagataeibacter europaeus]GBQ47526.1 hypothetical protein AA18890_2785 [Komagataeibacter europaeus LMG 18890]